MLCMQISYSVFAGREATYICVCRLETVIFSGVIFLTHTCLIRPWF